jgi:hypothetical protein
MKKFAAFLAIAVAAMFSAGMVIGAIAPDKITTGRCKIKAGGVQPQGLPRRGPTARTATTRTSPARRRSAPIAQGQGGRQEGRAEGRFHTRKECHKKMAKGLSK